MPSISDPGDRDALFVPSLQDSADTVYQPPPWRISSQFVVGFLGGALATTAIAWLNARRLRLRPGRRRGILIVGAAGVVLSLVLAAILFRTAAPGLRPASAVRLSNRLVGLLVYLVLAKIQLPGDRLFAVHGGGEHASLWIAGALAIVLGGLLQALLTYATIALPAGGSF